MSSRLKKTKKKYGSKLSAKAFIVLFSIGFLIMLALATSGWFIVKLRVIPRASNYFMHMVHNSVEETSNYFGLTLQNIYLEGQKFTPQHSLDEILNLAKGQPILTIPIADIKIRIEELDWVDHANIERHIPNTLHVRIVEKNPVAIWQVRGGLSLLDENGKIISAQHIKNFVHLPVVVGEGANEKLPDLLAVISEDKKYFEMVNSIIWVGKRRWNIGLKNKVEIMLPEENYDKAWNYLVDLDKEKKILSRDIKSVDLRLPDRVFIK